MFPGKKNSNFITYLCALGANKIVENFVNPFQQGEDEAMFEEYRKQLKTIFNNLASLDSQLVLITVHNIVTHTLSQWENMEMKDIEVAITLLYILGEAMPVSQYIGSFWYLHIGDSFAYWETLVAGYLEILVTGKIWYPDLGISVMNIW